jgi:hypothetical protein
LSGSLILLSLLCCARGFTLLLFSLTLILLTLLVLLRLLLPSATSVAGRLPLIFLLLSFLLLLLPTATTALGERHVSGADEHCECERS